MTDKGIGSCSAYYTDLEENTKDQSFTRHVKEFVGSTDDVYSGRRTTQEVQTYIHTCM